MKLIEKIESMKRQLANNLGAISDRYSTKTKKWTLIISGLFCASLCITTMVLPFRYQKRHSSIDRDSIPVVLQPPRASLSAQEYRLLDGFVKTMDSLKRVDSDAYQKAIVGREGMIDSILFLLRHSGEALIGK